MSGRNQGQSSLATNEILNHLPWKGQQKIDKSLPCLVLYELSVIREEMKRCRKEVIVRGSRVCFVRDCKCAMKWNILSRVYGRLTIVSFRRVPETVIHRGGCTKARNLNDGNNCSPSQILRQRKWEQSALVLLQMFSPLGDQLVFFTLVHAALASPCVFILFPSSVSKLSVWNTAAAPLDWERQGCWQVWQFTGSRLKEEGGGYLHTCFSPRLYCLSLTSSFIGVIFRCLHACFTVSSFML